jgi:hypothetical protein
MADAVVHHNAWFPGRLIGGLALVTGPVVWCAGLLVRALAFRTAGFTPAQLEAFDRQPFAAPAQLAAYEVNPALVTAGYALFVAGALLMWPAIVTLARIVAARSPALAYSGGALMIFGLFARAYFAGVDQTAFQLTEMLGLEQTTRVVMDSYVDISYGPWWIPVTASAGQYVGALLLGIGAYRSATFGLGRTLLFVWPWTLWGGVLKQSDFPDAVGAGALCLVLVPLGIRVLRDRVPALRTWTEESAPAEPRRALSW